MKIGEAPLLGLAQDFHPLGNAPAERTTIKHLRISAKVLYYYYCFYITKFKYHLCYYINLFAILAKGTVW